MPVFIIPGILNRPNFYEPVVQKLVQEGLQAFTIDLGLNWKSIEKAGEIIYEQLTKTPEKKDVIAHSRGGIIIKYLLSKRPELKDLIRTLIFVSVPHGGSWVSLLISFSPGGRELLPFTKYLKDLAHVQLPENTVNVLAQTELKIFPRKHALLKGYIDIVIPHTTHDNIMWNDNFIKKAAAFIKNGQDRVFL